MSEPKRVLQGSWYPLQKAEWGAGGSHDAVHYDTPLADCVVLLRDGEKVGPLEPWMVQTLRDYFAHLNHARFSLIADAIEEILKGGET